MRRRLFWSSASLIAYVYALFPLPAVARGLLFPRPVRQADIEPEVSLLIAARNEAAAMPSKLANLAALDYPRIASRSSSPRTAPPTPRTTSWPTTLGGRGRTCASSRCRPAGRPRRSMPRRRSPGARSSLLDANSLFRADAIRELAWPLADPDVGGVAGNQVYSLDGIDGEAAGERGYWPSTRS